MTMPTLTTTGLIGRIAWSPERPAVGESVKFDVHGPDGKPYRNSPSPLIFIDGNVGSEQYLQFAAPGTHTVTVIARGADAGVVERRAVQVDVVGHTASARGTTQPPIPLFLALRGHPNLLPYGAHLSIAPVAGAQPVVASYEWHFGDGSAPVTTTTNEVLHDFAAALDPARELQQFHVRVVVTTPQGKPPVRTKEATATSGQMPTGGTGQVTTQTYTRTVTVLNAYAAGKSRGALVLPVTTGTWARKAGQVFLGSATVTNPESTPLTLDSRVVVPILADTAQQTDVSTVEPVTPAITVPPKGSVDIQVSVPFSLVDQNALGFTVTYAGTHVAPELQPMLSRRPITGPSVPTPGTIKQAILAVRASAHFLVQPSDQQSDTPRFGDISTVGMLRDGKNSELNVLLGGAAIPGWSGWAAAPSPATVTPQPALGRETAGPAGLAGPPPAAPTHRIMADPPAPMPPPAPGNVCDPDNLPENVPPGLACQLTDQVQSVVTPSLFINARKGDVILSPTGPSMIGQLLSQVDPAQFYSHSGIMTRNHDQITHCTASEQRYINYPVGAQGPSDGFREDIVKFGFPGVITQSIDDVRTTLMFDDPDPTHPASAPQVPVGPSFDTVPSGLNQPGGAFTIVPPLVVKPDPMIETQQVRSDLVRVADDAAAHAGKGHYRFFAYSQADIAIDPAHVAPSSAGWAAGTFPAVCSSFIWSAMKRCGLECVGAAQIETSSEFTPAALAAGAQTDSQTMDGLLFYTADERVKAAQWLHDFLEEEASAQVSAQAGALSGAFTLLTDAPEQIANQFCNAFANDDCSSSNGSTAWQNPGTGNAVSPENILFWNGPDRGGVYGYAEPLVLQPPTQQVVPIYKWVQVTQYGALSGTVTFNGQPQAGVTLQLSSNQVTVSGSDGSFSFTNVAYGAYTLSAQGKLVIGGDFESATMPVTIEAATTQVAVALRIPDSDYRQVTVAGSIDLTCNKNEVFSTSHTEHSTGFAVTFDLGPWQTHGEQSIQQFVVDSATFDATFTADLNPDLSVSVGWTLVLDKDNNPNTLSNTTSVPAGGSMGFEWDQNQNNDISKTTFQITNQIWQT